MLVEEVNISEVKNLFRAADLLPTIRYVANSLNGAQSAGLNSFLSRIEESKENRNTFCFNKELDIPSIVNCI